MFDGGALRVAVVAGGPWRVRRRVDWRVRAVKPTTGASREPTAAAEPSDVTQRQRPMVRADLATKWLAHR